MQTVTFTGIVGMTEEAIAGARQKRRLLSAFQSLSCEVAMIANGQGLDVIEVFYSDGSCTKNDSKVGCCCKPGEYCN